MPLMPYVQIARPEHWFKNIFMLPGILLAFFFCREAFSLAALWSILGGVICACLIASSNYVLNEILDAPYDRHHPEKSRRPVPAGQINIRAAYGLWLSLALIGLAGAFLINRLFGFSSLALWIMGLLYNTPPIRLKDWPYADVLSESINNPIRLAMGWYATGLLAPPPLSMVLAYWMFGAFLMAVKRFAEFRHIGQGQLAANYRRSFGYYTEEKLLLLILFCAGFFGMLSGVFVARYSLELTLAAPLVIYTMSYYLHLGFKPNSPTQYPEKLFQHKKLVYLVALAFIVCAGALFLDLPGLKQLLVPRILPPTS
ncbi:MAG: UbiA prenyltransferase family protein [Lentisphaerae bacterium]|nr:UbiA prenyltransferase family protein [Lentisphaerota bacterium]